MFQASLESWSNPWGGNCRMGALLQIHFWDQSFYDKAKPTATNSTTTSMSKSMSMSMPVPIPVSPSLPLSSSIVVEKEKEKEKEKVKPGASPAFKWHSTHLMFSELCAIFGGLKPTVYHVCFN